MGFSLVEVLLAIVLLGILSSLCYPIARNVIEKSKEQLAICFAESVNAAKSSFWMRNTFAEEEYAQQTTNEGRYNLIKEYLSNNNIPLAHALPEGFDLIMNGGIRERVNIVNKKGENVY